jgi:ribose transport system substrate-binding protein
MSSPLRLPAARLRARRPAFAACTVAVLLASAACTSSSSDSATSSDGVDVDGAVEAVDAASSEPEFTLDAPAIDASKIAGKTVFNVPLSSEIPYVAAVDDEIERVVEAHGGKYVEFPNSGQPSEWAAGISQAISVKADVIILSQGPDPKVLIPQLERAEKAGIPVVLSHLYSVGEELPAEVADLVDATTNVDFAEAGRLMVDAAIAQTDGAVHALVVSSDEVAPSKGITAAIEEQFEKRCPDACSVEVTNVPLVDWGTQLSTVTQTTLQKNPDINWVLPLYDSMSLGVISGINSAGKGSTVGVASYNGTPDILKLIQDGGPMKVDVGESTAWLGRAAADQAFRLLVDTEPVAGGDVKTPLRVFTEDNVDEAGTPPEASKGYGDAYVTGYDALWTSDS